jgi:hypothetical protein
MWTAFHLEDGTRVRAVTMPHLPGFVVYRTMGLPTRSTLPTG